MKQGKYQACEVCVFEKPEYLEDLKKVKEQNPELIKQQEELKKSVNRNDSIFRICSYGGSVSTYK